MRKAGIFGTKIWLVDCWLTGHESWNSHSVFSQFTFTSNHVWSMRKEVEFREKKSVWLTINGPLILEWKKRVSQFTFMSGLVWLMRRGREYWNENVANSWISKDVFHSMSYPVWLLRKGGSFETKMWLILGLAKAFFTQCLTLFGC
jgi:hypothetical protein